MRVSVVDYGVGNIFSVSAALDLLGIPFVGDTDGSTLAGSSVALVPGVAAFGAGLSRLRASGQAEALVAHHAAGRPVVGLCLGAQMLLDGSTEAPDVAGLSLVPGEVVRLDPAGCRVPSQGWFRLEGEEPGLAPGTYAYFSHSYRMLPGEGAQVTARTRTGTEEVVAVYRAPGIVGVQFHPERSGPDGLAFLDRLLRSLE